MDESAGPGRDDGARVEPGWRRRARAAYDVVAVSYAALLADELAHAAVDRAVLGLYAELVGPGAEVADLGCGPGRVTAHLVGLGLRARGLDLSPGMVAEARRRHPDLSFEVGDLCDLPLADASLDGALAWYSLIHLPPDVLPVAAAELARVLRPGGRLVTAFQVGDVRVHHTHAYGHDLDLDGWRMDPDRVTTVLGEAGLRVHARLVREAEGQEKGPRAFLLAAKE